MLISWHSSEPSAFLYKLLCNSTNMKQHYSRSRGSNAPMFSAQKFRKCTRGSCLYRHYILEPADMSFLTVLLPTLMIPAMTSVPAVVKLTT